MVIFKTVAFAGAPIAHHVEPVRRAKADFLPQQTRIDSSMSSLLSPAFSSFSSCHCQFFKKCLLFLFKSSLKTVRFFSFFELFISVSQMMLCSAVRCSVTVQTRVFMDISRVLMYKHQDNKPKYPILLQ